MEVFRLDKAIDNEKIDLELAIGQLKKAKEKLSQSLKRRKDLALQMNDHLYIEERIEDIHSESNQRTIRKEWYTPRRSEKTEKRTRNSVSKIMRSNGREKQDKRRDRRKEQ